MATTINSISSIQNFNTLEITSERATYQEANETHNVALVRKLNSLGMKPIVPGFSGPTIISNFMDIATKYDIILGFLKALRQTNRLLTQEEFQPLSAKQWFQKSSLSRILGCDHLMQKIKEKQLTRMKTPLKIAVVEDTEILKINGWYYTDNLYEFNSKQITIYAEEIVQVGRTLSRDEINEFIQLAEAANFLDFCPSNIVVAEDGVYFIDTEFKSFAGAICWGKMARFESIISKEDLSYFQEKIKEKMSEPERIKENNGYSYLKNTLSLFGKLPKSTLEENEKKAIEEFKNKISHLEYVGAKEVGDSWRTPNKFSFNLRDILT